MEDVKLLLKNINSKKYDLKIFFFKSIEWKLESYFKIHVINFKKLNKKNEIISNINLILKLLS